MLEDLKQIKSNVQRLESDKDNLIQELKTVKAQIKVLELSQKAQRQTIEKQFIEKPDSLLESELLNLYEAECTSSRADCVQYYMERIPQMSVERASELSNAALFLKVVSEYAKNNGVNLKKRPFFADLEVIATKWQLKTFPKSEKHIRTKVLRVVAGELPEDLINTSTYGNQHARKSDKKP